MRIVYDHTITDARRTVSTHRPDRPDQKATHETTCATCGALWPCKSFSAAFALITRNSNKR
jgi:hypothetical protein